MKKNRKTLQELTIIDNFLFGAVMADPESCRCLLECILEIAIERVEIIPEKSLIYHPEYRGVRLDVFARDEKGTRFDVEMQVRKTRVERRSRYYHSQMDMEMISTGTEYDKLPDGYVIFICDGDPFDNGKYRYTIDSRCKECPDMEFRDGVHTIILNNRGRNSEEVSPELVNFLQYTKQPLDKCMEDSGDPFIRLIQDRIRWVKGSREMGERFMTLQEMLSEERAEGRAEGKAEERENLLKELVDEGLLSPEAAAQKLKAGVNSDKTAE